jgi:hypothetical protein
MEDGADCAEAAFALAHIGVVTDTAAACARNSLLVVIPFSFCFLTVCLRLFDYGRFQFRLQALIC